MSGVNKEIEQAGLKGAYESTFNGEEKFLHNLIAVKSNIKIEYKKVHIEDLITSNFKKISRDKTLIGLTEIVNEWDVVSPIHVMKLEQDDMYLLLDGLRRVFACVRNGLTEVPAMVWDFEDKQEGKDLANIISLMINRSQKFTTREIWAQMQLLEAHNDVGPGLIEFLLQMEAGDSMKLKDIMLSGASYDEIREALLIGELTIEGAYKKLAVARKKENKLEQEDAMTIDDVAASEKQRLGVEEVKDLLELANANVEDIGMAELDMSEEVHESIEDNPVVQDVNNRKPIDKEIKQETLQRDKFACRCCGIGGEEWLGILVYHHLVPVYAGGPDTVDNGLTICVNCHLTLHNYAFGKVKVNLESLSDKQKQTFKNIFKYGNIAINATKKMGLKTDEAYKKDAPSRRHPYPGENLQVNNTAFASQEAFNKLKD